MNKIEIAKELMTLEGQRRNKKEEKRRVDSQLNILENEIERLSIKMSKIDGLPIINLIHYDPVSYKPKREFWIEDPKDKLLRDWTDEGCTLLAGCPSVAFAHYSMSEHPLNVIAEGEVKFVREGYDEYRDPLIFESKVLTSPNYVEALMQFFKSMNKLDNFHHVFMEGVYQDGEEDGVKIFKFSYGS